jgi:hypothetical protein
MSDRKITNTTAEISANPMLGLATAMFGGIEAMESRGQAELVESGQIPTKLSHGLDEAMLESMGFKLGPVCEGDKLFREATLPPGWTRKPTDHAMWSKIVDGRGRSRLSVFYKAAFYDRSAHMSANRRFSYETDYGDRDKGRPQICRLFITDAGGRVGDPVATYDDDLPGEYDKAHAAAKAWLSANRPDWESPLAYWDEA